VPVVEDACHSFGTTVSGLLAGCAGSAGFFSGQWNKPINTGLGGILVVRDPALAKRIREDRASAVRPGRAEALQLRLLMLAHASLVGPRTYPLAQAAYRALSASGIVAGSSSPEEMAGRLPEDYFKLMSAAQAQAGLAEARHFAAGVRARAALQDLYPRMLAAAGFDPPTLPPGTVLSRYPVRVDRKPEVVAAAARLGIEIGTWFETPLHPLPMERHREHGYIAGACPRAEEAAAQVVNLPIRRTTTGSEAERCVDFLARHARPARPA
jgi:dTDP-4-amino-4,6-dideoxygalactose transaminase